MKADKWIWGLIFLGLVGLCGWNIWQNRRLHEQLRVSAIGSAEAELVDGVLQNRSYELAQAGKIIVWPEELEIIGEGEPARTGHTLVLAVSEVSCNTCRERETRFVLELAAGADFLKIVVHADNPRYARSYMRLNAIDRPVFFDRSGAFFRANQLSDSPILLLLNERDEVLAAHVPIPGHPKISDPFHNLCRAFFDPATL